MIALLRTDLGDPARTLAIRAGFVVALVGMALALLMTLPTADQTLNYRGIVGAHTVGAPDGAPGLPILGWSTEAGDLRIPHFVGMHALQLLPLTAVVLELLARRGSVLQSSRVRRQLVWVAIAAYLGFLAVLTGQALHGESIVHPGAPVIAVTSLLLGAMVGAIVVILGRARAAASARPDGARSPGTKPAPHGRLRSRATRTGGRQ